jgi:CDP-diacylglycerol pyrophosphatase
MSARPRRMVAATAIVVALFLPAAAAIAFDPNALWNVVHGECVPNQLQHGDPKPCAQVDLKNGVDQGYAVLKDRNGPAQFLLIPTKRITGIESPELLADNARNYFADAWDARHYVEQMLGHAMPIDTLSLAVNSVWARTQNQLHIHIDCIRADVRQALATQREKIGQSWAPLGEPLDGHSYMAMRVSGTTLDGHNPFTLLAQGVPGASVDMGERTLVVFGMLFGDQLPGFVILEDRANFVGLDFAAGARLQDHNCALGH